MGTGTQEEPLVKTHSLAKSEASGSNYNILVQMHGGSETREEGTLYFRAFGVPQLLVL